MTTLSQIVCRVCQGKNFENRSITGEDTEKSKVARFFGSPCIKLMNNYTKIGTSTIIFCDHWNYSQTTQNATTAISYYYHNLDTVSWLAGGGSFDLQQFYPQNFHKLRDPAISVVG